MRQTEGSAAATAAANSRRRKSPGSVTIRFYSLSPFTAAITASVT